MSDDLHADTATYAALAAAEKAVDTLKGERDQARAAAATADRLRQEETDEYDQLITMQGRLLTGVADALKGDPPDRVLHDHSDLPVVAAQLVAESDELRAGMVAVLAVVRAYVERRTPEGARQLAELLVDALHEEKRDE